MSFLADQNFIFHMIFLLEIALPDGKGISTFAQT